MNIGDPYEVNCDNQAAIKMSEHATLTARTKHIEVRASFIADAIKNGLINLQYIHTTENLADHLTKPMAAGDLERFLSSSGRGAKAQKQAVAQLKTNKKKKRKIGQD